MPDFIPSEMAEWLEATVRTMFEEDTESIVVAARLKGGYTMTAYYHADAERKAVFAHHINSDAMMDVVTSNIDMIRDALDRLEDDDA